MTCLKELALPEMLNFLPEPFWLTLLGCNYDDNDNDGANNNDAYENDDDDMHFNDDVMTMMTLALFGT